MFRDNNPMILKYSIAFGKRKLYSIGSDCLLLGGLNLLIEKSLHQFPTRSLLNKSIIQVFT